MGSEASGGLSVRAVPAPAWARAACASGSCGASEPRLIVETAKSAATQAVLRVVDESIERAAKAREERERAEAERRREEEARQRVEHAEEAERRDAERMRDRVERQADEIARNEAQKRAEVRGEQAALYIAPGSRLDVAA
jgi:translation initiation factor IF-2